MRAPYLSAGLTDTARNRDVWLGSASRLRGQVLSCCFDQPPPGLTDRMKGSPVSHLPERGEEEEGLVGLGCTAEDF